MHIGDFSLPIDNSIHSLYSLVQIVSHHLNFVVFFFFFFFFGGGFFNFNNYQQAPQEKNSDMDTLVLNAASMFVFFHQPELLSTLFCKSK